ncbi:Chemotaxis protein methyltransferase CheR [hydrothermal vent metagenome]|uniref:protein-glutamate O-methyltransferase n=1 Tax=hydrothermal vent metagenome TaxID=652676 RepID=A0A3B0UDR3_9ZZZZ
MKSEEFQTISDFVRNSSGIILSQSKEYLVDSRLKPIAEQFGFADVGALARGLERANREVKLAVTDAMTTNETFFFRDKTPFALFEEIILPNIVKTQRSSGRLRIWCAASSTGQEPYSLAMLLLKHKRLWAGMRAEILATDISPTAIEKAKEGRFSQFEVQRGLPVQLLVEHFTQDGTHWIISDQIRQMVKFSQLNLLDPYHSIGTVDVVYCRNVLIYFDAETKRKVLTSVRRVMRETGYLVLGAADTVMGSNGEFERADGKRGLYQPVEAGKRKLAMTG